MLKQSALIVALGLTPAFGTAVVMASGPAPAPMAEEDVQVTGGKVLSIDTEASRFVIEVAPLEHVNVDWNDETEFTLDGETSTANEVLVADRMVTVEHTDGMASAVRGTSEEVPPEDAPE